MSLSYTDREEKILNYDMDFLRTDIQETKRRVQSAMDRVLYMEKRYNNLLLTLQHRASEHEDVTPLQKSITKAVRAA